MRPTSEPSSTENITQWNHVIQRATVDAEFRAKLLKDPKLTLEEAGIYIGDGKVIIHEFDPKERHFFLPPLITHQVVGKTTPFSKEPPSDPIRGAVTAALHTEDSRVWYGTTKIN